MTNTANTFYNTAMIWSYTRRMMRSGFIGFWRNGTVSLAAIFAMLITLSVVGALMVGNVFLSLVPGAVKEEGGVALFFSIGAAEPDILAPKKIPGDAPRSEPR